MALRNYDEAVRVARALIEPPLVPDEGNAEYARGIVEFMADLYPRAEGTGVWMAERKQAIAIDIGLDPVLVA